MHKVRQKLILGLALIFGISVATYKLFESGILRLNYPSQSRFPVRGIDVSHHQGEIDWSKIKSEGVSFAFIKATEGGDHTDRKFRENWERSKAAGVLRGAYHFFTFCKSGAEQSQNVLHTVPADADFPLVLDLEFGGNCNKRPSVEELAKEVADFVARTEKLHRGLPIFYVTPEFYEEFLVKQAAYFPRHILWLRNVFYEPRQTNCEKWTLWQFANRGRMAGIKGPVDLNVFCGNQEQFQKQFGTSSN